MRESWIDSNSLDRILNVEGLTVMAFSALISWIIYLLALKRLSRDRHLRLRKLFKDLLLHFILGSASLLFYRVSLAFSVRSAFAFKISPYLGLIAIGLGIAFLVKTARIFALEFFLRGNTRVGTPLLLVDIFTFALTLILIATMARILLPFDFSPFIATSAIVSVILGLALQDTLGNLFAGVSLQIDKPYLMGEWIEVDSNSQKWKGQVIELTWRATALRGFAEEIIHISNRTMAQSQISNFSRDKSPIVRSQVLRVPYSAEALEIKRLAVEAILRVKGVLSYPPPMGLFIDTEASWINLKIIYFIADYGQQFFISDRVLAKILELIERNNLLLANPALELIDSRLKDSLKLEKAISSF